MEDCIFCKIINQQIPSFKVHESKDHLSFLDINPNTKAVTLVIPKKHISSTVINMDNDVFVQTMLEAKKVAEHLSNKLNVQRVGIAVEGTGVDHFHIKLYPFYRDPNVDDKKLREIVESRSKPFNDFYQGYLSTQIGPQANFDELKKISEELFF